MTWKIVLSALALAPIAMVAFGQSTVPATTTPISTLVVQGAGRFASAPDQASVRLGVVAQGKTAKSAQEQVNKKAAAILAALKKLGFGDKELQTSDLNVSPLYVTENNPNGESRPPRITGYQASNAVTAKTKKLELLGPAIDAGLDAGANQVEGVSFQLENDSAARSAALSAAVREARDKAKTIARALDVRLVEAIEVTEGGVNVFTPRYEGLAMRAMADSISAPTPVAAGEVSVDASVTIRFRIAPCPPGEPGKCEP